MSKFNLSDTIYLIEDSKAVLGVIVGIYYEEGRLTLTDIKPSRDSTLESITKQYSARIKQEPVIYDIQTFKAKSSKREEKFIFRTKEELIASL